MWWGNQTAVPLAPRQGQRRGPAWSRGVELQMWFFLEGGRKKVSCNSIRPDERHPSISFYRAVKELKDLKGQTLMTQDRVHADNTWFPIETLFLSSLSPLIKINLKSFVDYNLSLVSDVAWLFTLVQRESHCTRQASCRCALSQWRDILNWSDLRTDKRTRFVAISHPAECSVNY